MWIVSEAVPELLTPLGLHQELFGEALGRPNLCHHPSGQAAPSSPVVDFRHRPVSKSDFHTLR